MAQLHQSFDSQQHDDMNEFNPIPRGKYVAKVTNSDFKPTKKKDGKYLALEFEIMKGEFKGRKIWTNLNLVNPNPVAVEIANKELATLCRAVGKTVIQDSNELHGIPFELSVKIIPAKGDYPAKNGPANYKPLHSSGSETEIPANTGQGSEIDDDDIPWS